MGIDKEKVRKEVHLTEKVIENLQKLADKQGRSLKNFMEYTLTQTSEKK